MCHSHLISDIKLIRKVAPLMEVADQEQERLRNSRFREEDGGFKLKMRRVGDLKDIIAIPKYKEEGEKHKIKSLEELISRLARNIRGR